MNENIYLEPNYGRCEQAWIVNERRRNKGKEKRIEGCGMRKGASRGRDEKGDDSEGGKMQGKGRIEEERNCIQRKVESESEEEEG